MNIAIILSGGTGTRMGLSIPKQYVEVNGKPVIEYCLSTLLGHDKIDIAVIAASTEWHDLIDECINKLSSSTPVFF